MSTSNDSDSDSGSAARSTAPRESSTPTEILGAADTQPVCDASDAGAADTAIAASDAPAAMEAPVAVAAPQVVWHSSLLDLSGYAQVARITVRGLVAAGVPLRVSPIWGSMKELAPGDHPPDAVIMEVPSRPGSPPRRFRADVGADEAREFAALAERCVRPDVVILHHVAGMPDGRDFFNEMRSRHPGAFWTIGSTMFETDRIPEAWVGPCNRLDEIWVPTRFNQATFAASGVDPALLRVMPFGVPKLKAGDVDPSYRIESAKTFKFLSVFELTARKGWDVLIRAYVESFKASDDVALVVKSYGRGGVRPSETFVDYIRSLGRDPDDIPEIVVIEDRLTDAQMRGLYTQCDAFVLPSRGEGWGMPYLEAQQHGLPVIATRWSGQLEFLNEKNAFLIDTDGLMDVDARQIKDDPIYAGHRYANPSVASTSAELLRVFGDATERRRRADAGRRDAEERWTAERSAARMRARLDEIEARRLAFLKAANAAAARPADVVWSGPLAAPSGYGAEARMFVSALESAGTTVAVRAQSWDRREAAMDRTEREALHRRMIAPIAPDAVVVHHTLGDNYRRGPERISVVRTMFESDRLPDGWAESLQNADEIWVPSRHNAAVFAAGGIPRAKIAVVPGTIDMDAYAPDGPALELAPSGTFVFLSIFEWGMRKAPELLLRTYARLFAGRSDVLLALRIAPPPGRTAAQVRYAVESMIARYTPEGGTPAQIRLLDTLGENELTSAYRGADAFVLPTRGEGFGRPMLEAAAVGLPVITTRWSGPCDFLDDRTAYLVDAAMTPVPESVWTELPRFKGHRWAEPDAAKLAAHMASVVADPVRAAAVGARAANSVRRTHSPAVVAARIQARLAALRG